MSPNIGRRIVARTGYFLLVLLMILFLPLTVWVAVVCGLWQTIREVRLEKAAQLQGEAFMACAIDADCPPAFICMNGRCMPAYDQ